MTTEQLIYKITPHSEWKQAEADGCYKGAPIDFQDGFIHFSAAGQVRETAAKHFAGQDNLLLVAVRCGTLGSALKWETSRGGALFPHLYADLQLDHVAWVKPMPLSDQGSHDLPEELA